MTKRMVLGILGFVVFIAVLFMVVYTARIRMIDEEVNKLSYEEDAEAITIEDIKIYSDDEEYTFEQFLPTAKAGETFECSITLSDGTKKEHTQGYIVNGDEDRYWLDNGVVKISKRSDEDAGD